MNQTLENSDQPPLTIYVANMAEDVWQLIETLPQKQKLEDIHGCDLTSDRELSAFLDTENFVLISPKPVDQRFIDYMHTLKPKKCFAVWIPKNKSGQMCIDIANDPQIMENIRDLSKNYDLRLESYTASQQLIQLINTLHSENISITAPLTPKPADIDVVNFFGSKLGLRSFYESHSYICPNFSMSPGRVHQNKPDAIAYAQTLYNQGLGAVFKTPKGHSGIGVVIVKNNAIQPDWEALLSAPYWDAFPIVVETCVDIDMSVAGGNPNAECLVDENGDVHVLFYCGMRVSTNGAFQGIEIGQEIFPTDVAKKLTCLAECLGKEYAKRGYRGYFDIDCMTDKNGQLFVSESNVRRTGGTHVYHLGKALLKDSFDEKYILSNNYFSLSPNDWNTNKILTVLSPILYSPIKKTGFILAGANTLMENFLTYTIIGNDEANALQIEQEMIRLLSQVQDFEPKVK